MNNHNDISIPRNLFIALCVAAAVLAIAFVIALIKLQSQPPLGGGEQEPTKYLIVQESDNPAPVEPRFLEFLKKGNYSEFVLVNLEGQVRIIGLDGRDKMPCGEIVGSEIRPLPYRNDCPSFKNIELTHLGLLHFVVFEGSPGRVCWVDRYYVC